MSWAKVLFTSMEMVASQVHPKKNNRVSRQELCGEKVLATIYSRNAALFTDPNVIIRGRTSN